MQDFRVRDEVKAMRPGLLEPHPLNKKLYGTLGVLKDGCEHFTDLRDSIKERGILVPLLITPDNVIVSGHSRWSLAKLLNIDEVPVQVLDETDPLKIEEAVIHSNRQRAKTKEQRGRETKRLKAIESERAKARLATSTGGASPRPRANLPEAETGRAADKAAAAVGWSRRTAEKAEKVVDAIDEAEATGDTEKAEGLRDTLENQSVDAAYREVKPSKPKPKEPEPEPQPQPAQPPRLDASEASILEHLKHKWNKTPERVREAFLDWLEDEGQLAA